MRIRCDSDEAGLQDGRRDGGAARAVAQARPGDGRAGQAGGGADGRGAGNPAGQQRPQGLLRHQAALAQVTLPAAGGAPPAPAAARRQER
eukprot:6805601-Pyramimonas_sp.AAC.1